MTPKLVWTLKKSIYPPRLYDKTSICLLSNLTCQSRKVSFDFIVISLPPLPNKQQWQDKLPFTGKNPWFGPGSDWGDSTVEGQPGNNELLIRWLHLG